MNQMKFVCLYISYLDGFQQLSDAAVGKLVRTMLQYAITGEDVPVTGKAAILWPSIRSQMDRDAEKYRDRCEINRINAAKGGRPRKNRSVILETDRLFEKPKKPNEKENEKENKNDIYKNINNDSKNEIGLTGCGFSGEYRGSNVFPIYAADEFDDDFVEREDWDPSVSPFGTPGYRRADSSELRRWPQV